MHGFACMQELVKLQLHHGGKKDPSTSGSWDYKLHRVLRTVRNRKLASIGETACLTSLLACLTLLDKNLQL